ncbi:MAG: DinB family protein [Bacteroidia bacterium]|nr:DinB family protein [Bacteroidia bacterium]
MAISSTDVYPEYYETYISKVQEQDLLMALLKNKGDTIDLFRNVTADKEDYKYEKGKWSIKEVLQHLMDTERVMAYRALRFSRGDDTELPGFDQDVFTKEYHLDSINLDQLIEEFISIRNSTILFYRHLSDKHLDYRGIASGWPMSVNALLHVIVGHAEHHNRIINERYL